MTQPLIWRVGSLATHVRGKVLAEASGARPVDPLPDDFGLGLMFGTEFQDADAAGKQQLCRWSEPAGRVLLLIPPFRVGAEALPADWRIYRPSRTDPTGADKLAKLLGPEVRFEVTGSVQVATEVNGQWNSGGIHTGYYRKHPHAGLFAVTCLPLWSLTVLDHRATLRDWLSTLLGVAGEPAPAKDTDEPGCDFRPNKNHYAVMLHLCQRDFGSRQEALATLADSPVLALPNETADQCLRELAAAGLITEVKLTEAGRDLLFNSPYATYAEAMEAARR